MTRYRLKLGDCLEVMKDIPDNSFHSCVTDPPYGLKFMGKEWDHGVPGEVFWKEIIRVVKPGAHLLAFGGTRTHHRLMVEIEDAGWEIRDTLMWLYGVGMPKHISLLKPAWEPIIMAAKRGKRSLNIDACRIEAENRPLRVLDAKPEANGAVYAGRREYGGGFDGGSKAVGTTNLGRYPANLLLDEEAGEMLPNAKGQQGNLIGHDHDIESVNGIYGKLPPRYDAIKREEENQSASRFFYCSKASKSDRGEGNNHVAVKPTDLMRYLCRLVTPPNGIVFDPFLGSGSTLKAAILEGFRGYGIEKEENYFQIAQSRIENILDSK